MPTTTPRLALQKPLGADTPAALRTTATNNATTLDNAAIFLSGTFVGRPAAGIAGRYYLATDVHDGGPQGTLYQDNGSTWVYPNQIAYQQGTLGSRSTAGTTGRVYYATDTGQLSLDTGSAWLSIMVPTPWQNLTPVAGWLAAGSPHAPRARLEGDVVRLAGTLQNNTGGTFSSGSIASLPSGRAPTGLMNIWTATGAGTTLAKLNIFPSGDVQIATLINGPLINGDNVFLDGITYSLN